MEVSEAVIKRRWGVRRPVVARTLGGPRPFDLSPPQWVLGLFDGAQRAVLPREAPLSVSVRDVGRLTLATARVFGAKHLDDPAFERCAEQVYSSLADSECPLVKRTN